MPAPRVRADYDQLAQIAARFGREAERTQETIGKIKGLMSTLQGGDWIGKGATAFYREMDSEVMPSLTRLGKSLGEAQRSMNQIIQIVRGAEEEAARILGSILAMGDVTATAGAGGAGGAAPEWTEEIPTSWLKKSIDALKGAKWGLHHLSGLKAAKALELMPGVVSARNVMARIFSMGGEEALAKTGIPRLAAERLANLQRAAGMSHKLEQWSKRAGIAAVGVTTGKQYLDSSAETFLGKMTSAGLAGTFSYATKAAFPLYVADNALRASTGVSVIETFNGAYESVAVVGEGLITGESGGMARLHESFKAGDWGPPMRVIAEAGDFWAEHGVVAPVKEIWAAGVDVFR